ncbi:hypothetical protein GCM10011487_30340 [Steroidobacter agaridevorans]|uniref:Uncharacterized protein n=1 Tax=Steroidobacter agaridevorans TaxID=2695856 RepID=A0A829YCB6_9GAMM|nr:hypothetical protein [Steroidobacter agaridevorans]GFE81034.1 hypothetical protein GCM10011487_30340 [Steroidobacter agaridevorans]GFE89082.1 hypothetical protein GCM10011488_40360 [Steroidobacter agaridevorans]
MIAVLCACQPDTPPLPITGEIGLRHVSNSENEFVFALTNQSARAISLRGDRTESGRASAWDGWVACHEGTTGLWTPGPYTLVDGMPEIIEIGSARQLELVAGFAMPDEFLRDYRAGRCKLTLRLADGSLVTSEEFQP